MKQGDLVEVNTKDSSYKGVYMPNSTEDKLVLKLNSGYNVGILKKNVTKSKVLKGFVKKKAKKVKISKKKGKKNIIILHTGGTVASKVDYEIGGVSAHFTPEDLIEMVPELEKIANIDTKLVAEMMSEDMMFSDYQKMLDYIKKSKSDGVILTQGTDTLGYTAAALAFALEEVNIPVLVVGSQRSSDRGSSDAAMNLICAAEFIAKEGFKGVAVCMHDASSDNKCAIMSATKTRKMHTSRRDAFKVINGSPYAYVDFISRKVEKMGKYPVESKKLKIKDGFEGKVGILKTHPNMDSKLFEFYCKNYKGIVIEGTGLGHAPTNLGKNLKNYEQLKKYIKKGGIVVVTSQCLFGRVHPHVYVNLRRLEDIGCIFGEDMLPETAFIKLAWLLGSYPKDVKKLISKDLRGEISDRSLWKEDFLE
jgi:glutamyl-tRNA(Gln) amidotransferase subunit D